MELPVTPEWLSGALENESYVHWHAYFVKFFVNHKIQSAIALARIGATEERVKSHCEHENTKGGLVSFADKPDLVLALEADSLKSENIDDYLGAQVGYYRVLDHYTKLFESKYAKDVKKFIKNELPAVVDGQVGSVFHGIIQTGYGYRGKFDQAVVEGVAMSHIQFQQVESPMAKDLSRFGTGTTDIVDILKEVKQARKHGDETNPDAWKNVKAVAKNCGDVFFDLVDKIKLPIKLDPGNESMDQVVSLMDWVLDMSTLVFLQSDHVNDFFLLHGITGAWSLLQVIDLLDYKTAVIALRAHLAGLMCTFARVNPPGLTKRPEDYWQGETVDEAAWRKIIDQNMEKDYESHVHKICQCLYEAWKKNQDGPFAKYQIAASAVALATPFHH